MKPLRFFATLLVAVMSSCAAWAQAESLSGKILTLGEPATTLAENTWYVLGCPSQGMFVSEIEGNALTTTTNSPDNTSALDNAGMLICLEKQTDGRYCIRTGLGNYFGNVIANNNRGTLAEPSDLSPFTIAPIAGSEGHFSLMSTLKNGNKIYMSALENKLSGAMTTPQAGSARDWVFYTANLSAVGDLKGEAYVTYALNQFKLIRLTNRRSSNYNLADDGTKTLGERKNTNSLSQIWILSKAGDGYSLRNASTGRFLDDEDNFRTPNRSSVTLYFQYSPNNTGNTTWVNVAKNASFSGNVCLNENGDNPVNLHKWSCQNDAGSDWTISEVTEYTLDQVMEMMLASSRFKAPEDGQVYHIVNTGYEKVMYENTDGNKVGCQSADKNKFAQYWKLTKDGNKFYLQNLLTGRYLKRQNGSLSKVYSTTSTVSAADNGFPLNRTDNDADYNYSIVDNGNVGLHCDASSNVVGWYTDNGNSIWGFEIATVDEEALEAARQNLREFNALTRDIVVMNGRLEALFANKACTELKPEIAALSDEELAEKPHFANLTDDLKAIVLKVKNNTWRQFTNNTTGFTRDYERFFRIADYKVYSHHIKMANGEHTAMSNQYGRLSNPTGITGNAGDIVYIFVEGPISSDCTLAIECVSGSSATGTQTTLHEGLNAIMLGNQANLFVFYQLEDPSKYLANYPDIRVHIEGGRLNGYWDATRGMTNADWKLLQQDLLKESPMLNLKTEKLVFCMETQHVLAAEPNEIEGITRLWNTIVENEEYYMGLEEFKGRCNNIWNAISVDHNYMYASSYGSYYHWNTLSTVMNYDRMTRQNEGNEGGGLWGPSHEIGHNHQNTITVVGSMEASNNLFANINLFEQGVSTSRFGSAAKTIAHFNAGKHWHQGDINIDIAMYFQMYLYFHVMKNDTTFLQRLHKELRRRPINRYGNGRNASLKSADGEHTGGYDTRGSQDYLHFAKVCCDVAQADMSEFFEASGMFRPVDHVYCGDYADYICTTTQEEIDEARAYMMKYPKKLYNLMFIDDHIAKNQLADPNNKFEAKPAASGYKVNCSTQNLMKIGTAGSVGQYSDFSHEYLNTGYYYTKNKANGKITIVGNGAVGFKIYNKEGRLVYLANETTFNLPASLKDLDDSEYTIVAAEGNGADIVVPKGRNNVLVDVFYPGQETSRELYADAKFSLPSNALGFVRAAQEVEVPTTLLGTANVIDDNNHAQQIVIDGNQPWSNPATIEADQVVFTRQNEGYAALALPFEVSTTELPGLKTATVSNGDVTIIDAEKVAAGEPVVIEGNAEITKLNATLTKGEFAAQAEIITLAADGESIVSLSNAPAFLFNFDGATAIKGIKTGEDFSGKQIFDLQGRSLQSLPAQKGIYIMGQKKVLVK